MAEKDLGALILRLQADVTQLKTAIDAVKKVGAETDKTATKVTGLKSSFKGLLNVLPGCISQFLTLRSVMKINRQFTEQVKIQEEAVARLGSAIRSTGGIAGLTIKDFDKMAQSLQKASTRTMAEITNTQSIIAAFTNIRGKVFNDTMTTVLNLADAFEMDLKQVARSVGKALQDPTKGMLSLQRIGLGLTPVIHAQVKAFMSVNDVLSAQNLILDFLKTRLNWTSEMLAATLPGAIQQTKNAWDNLFRVGGTEGTERYRKSLIELRDALQTDEMKEFFKTMGSGWYTVKSFGAQIVTLALQFKELLVISGVTMMLVTLATTIKLVLLPAILAIGGAITTAFGPIGVAVTGAILAITSLITFLRRAKLEAKGLPTMSSLSGNAINVPIPQEAKVKVKDPYTAPWDLKSPEAIEGMMEEARLTEEAMQHLMNTVKYSGKSAKEALKEINDELKTFKNNGKVLIGGVERFDESFLVLQKYKELLETMSNKTFKNFAKSSKEAFTEMITSIKNQMKFLGTPGESFLPGLNTMLKQFPVLSEKWVALKELIISIENEVRDAQIENARIVREYRQRQEEELSEKRQKEMKKREQQWENMFALNKLGFMPSSDLLAKATEEYERLLDFYKTNPTDYLNWPKELIKSYEQVHNLLVEKVQPVMDTLNAQFENGTITNAQYVSALEKIKVQFEAYPSIVKLAEDAIVAFNLSAQASLPTVAGQVQSAWNDMNMAIAKAPSAIGDAFVSAIRGAENLGDAMRNLLQDIGAVIVKALLMKYILGPIMGFADGGIVGSVGTPASAVGLDNWVGAKSIFGKGGVFNSGQLTAFASGGIVNKPTLFPFASGIGLMGERGPEAIMPLKRTSSGDLGVQAEGGGGTTNITMNINAVDSRSFVEMMRTNRVSVENIVVENIMKNGTVRSAIRGLA